MTVLPKEGDIPSLKLLRLQEIFLMSETTGTGADPGVEKDAGSSYAILWPLGVGICVKAASVIPELVLFQGYFNTWIHHFCQVLGK